MTENENELRARLDETRRFRERMAKSISVMDELLQKQTETIDRLADATRRLREARTSTEEPFAEWEKELIHAPRWSRQAAYVRDGLDELDRVRSLVHDILTGANDVWAKAQLLDAIGAAESRLRSALC